MSEPNEHHHNGTDRPPTVEERAKVWRTQLDKRLTDLCNLINDAAKEGFVINYGTGPNATGHHHVMEAERTTMYRLPDSILDCLLVVEKPDELKHLRDFDTHEPLGFAPGTYKAITSREYVPEGWRKSLD